MISVRTPVPEDCERLLRWRNRDAVRELSNDPSLITGERHSAWFQNLLADREGQLGVVCLDARPVGVVQLTGLDLANSAATWGCHLGELDVPPGFGATLPVLSLALGLRGWNLDQLNAEVLETNRNMLGIHRRLGIRRLESAAPRVIRPDGTVINAHSFEVTKNDFDAIHERAQKLLTKKLSGSLTEAVESFSGIEFR